MPDDRLGDLRLHRAVITPEGITRSLNLWIDAGDGCLRHDRDLSFNAVVELFALFSFADLFLRPLLRRHQTAHAAGFGLLTLGLNLFRRWWDWFVGRAADHLRDVTRDTLTGFELRLRIGLQG